MGKRIRRNVKKFGKFLGEKDVRKRWRSSKKLKRERIEKLQTELTKGRDSFWKNNPDKDQVANFIRNIKFPSFQRKALKMFLKIEGLEFEDCYSLADLVIKIKGRVLKMAFWRKCFSLALPEDWVDTIKNENDEVIREIFLEELIRRIKNGFIPKQQGRQILIQIFEETPEPPEEKTRKRVWQLLKSLNLAEENLLKIAGLECMRSMIGVAGEVRDLLGRIKQEKNTADQRSKLFQQIIDEINQKTRELE